MEKSQSDLCHEILRRLNKAGVLADMMLIGSWCLPFYRDYFTGMKYRPAIRTRDMDFLLPFPGKIKRKTDIPEILRDLGFIVGFQGAKGYIRLEHPDLMVEFLVPERGRGVDGPVSVKSLGINATPLRFLNLLSAHTIQVKVEDFYVILPHPAYFAVHKLIVAQRRPREEKAFKDRQAAYEILKMLMKKGEINTIKTALDTLPKKWQEKVQKDLEILKIGAWHQ